MADVLVLLAKGFEEIEAVTVIDVLRRAESRVVTAAIGDREVSGSHGILMHADAGIEEVSGRTFDLIYLPGGMEGTERLAVDPRVGDMLRAQAGAGRRIAAICAAPLALQAHGIIPSGARVTSHPAVQHDLSGCAYSEDRVLIDENLITSRGPGTAMEMALALVDLISGPAVRSELEAAMLTASHGGGA